MWYSTTREGWCGAPSADPSTCTWDATVEKVVNKSCSDKRIHDAIEAYSRKGVGFGKSCFDQCPARRRHPFHARNTSDACWIYCYYSTLLGASHLLPSGKRDGDDGMPRDDILAAFAKPFLPLSQGGCPSVEPPPPASEPAARRRAGAPWRVRERIMDALYRAAATAAGEGRVAVEVDARFNHDSA